MTWETETREQVLFISPEGNIHTALWRANDRSIEKKLGIFDPPKFRGSFIQDMDIKSTSYPLTIYFEGFDHYKKANKFFDSMKNEVGQWQVNHPTKGNLVLQLVSAKELINPIENANYTAFDTEWLEPANVNILILPDEFAALALLEIINAIADAITQLKQLRADLYAAVQAIANMVNKISGLANSVMSELAITNSMINDEWNQAKNSLDTLITTFQTDPTDPETLEDLGNAVINVIAIPLQANSNYDIRFDYYNTFLAKMIAETPAGTGPEDYNKALFYELGIVGVMISASRIIITSEFKTRSEIISAMEKVTTLYNDCINSLDEIQERFSA
jgi:hypothetical protein